MLSEYFGYKRDGWDTSRPTFSASVFQIPPDTLIPEEFFDTIDKLWLHPKLDTYLLITESRID
jgi:hypothetical protein